MRIGHYIDPGSEIDTMYPVGGNTLGEVGRQPHEHRWDRTQVGPSTSVGIQQAQKSGEHLV